MMKFLRMTKAPDESGAFVLLAVVTNRVICEYGARVNKLVAHVYRSFLRLQKRQKK